MHSCEGFVFTVTAYTTRWLGRPVSQRGAGENASADRQVTRVTVVLKYSAYREQVPVAACQIAWTVLNCRGSYTTFKRTTYKKVRASKVAFILKLSCLLWETSICWCFLVSKGFSGANSHLHFHFLHLAASKNMKWCRVWLYFALPVLLAQV